MKRPKNEKPIRKEFLKFAVSLFALSLILYFIHELGHLAIQLFLGVPISMGFSWDKITTMADMNVLEYPSLTAFALAISGFATTIIPIIYLKRIIFVPKFIKEKINSFEIFAYLVLCFSLATLDFVIILRLFLR